jgi:hypothetical protein
VQLHNLNCSSKTTDALRDYDKSQHIDIYKTLRSVSVQGSAVSGCKRETEPINTKSVVKHVIRYQVLLAAYYKSRYQLLLLSCRGRQFSICLSFSKNINKS